jgi:CheY-like chemotaxis protein
MKSLNRLLVVENDLKDAKRASEVATEAGFSEIESKTSPLAARRYLEDRLAELQELPDGILLDLDFGYESGYELLRFWHGHPDLSSIPVIVWSVLGNEQKDMCALFKVKQYVGKWEGNEVLLDALKQIDAS